MYKVLIVFLFLISFSLKGQERLADGHKKFYYSNGQVSSEGLIKNGLPEGYWISYYPNGIIKSEGNRKASLLDSTWIFYSELGNFQSKINYKAGKKFGKKISYSDSCNVVLEEYFENDVKQKNTTSFYDIDGYIKKEEIPFVDNVKEGKGFEYAQDDGRIITLIFYKKGTLIGKEKINRKDRKGKKIGTWKKFYDGGRLKEESRYKNELLNGYLKEYDKNGKLVNATLYIDGVAQSYAQEISALDIRKEYYNDGTIRKEGIYDVIGKENGTFKYFNKKGKIEKTEIYIHGVLIAVGLIDEEGKRQGYWEEYYVEPEGQLKSKGKYKDGKKIDEWQYYFTNNQLQQIGKYVKYEKPSGLWKWYYESGKLLREENFRKGLEDGMLHEYLEDGSVITEGEFIDGRKEGVWLYQHGDHKEEGEYKDGYKSGIWKYTHLTNDELHFEGNFIDGEPDGKHRYYYENGKLKREEYYTMGIKRDNWKYFNEFGELTLTVYFKDGKEYKIDGTKLIDKK
jgi:antitoxin component YwqK of YwqJK toxin-antitoxin module